MSDEVTIAANVIKYGSMALGAVGGATYLKHVGKSALSRYFNNKSGLSRMDTTYRKAITSAYDLDVKHGAKVTGAKTLTGLQDGKFHFKDAISPEKMIESGVDNIVVLTPYDVTMIQAGADKTSKAAINEDLTLRLNEVAPKPKAVAKTINYNLSTIGRMSHAIWTRQFLSSPQKMIEQTYADIDLHAMRDHTDSCKALNKQAKKVGDVLSGMSNPPAGITGKIVDVLQKDQLARSARGINDALNYGVAVLLNTCGEDDRVAVEEGYMIFKTRDADGSMTIYALATTEAEEKWKQDFCEKRAHFWTGAEILDGLCEVNKQIAIDLGYPDYTSESRLDKPSVLAS